MWQFPHVYLSTSHRGSHRDSVSPTTPCKNNSLTIYDDATTSVMGHEDGASFGPGYGNNYSSQNYANSTSYKANNNYQKCQNSNTMPKIFTQDYENGKDSIVSRDKITTTESGPFESSITKVTKHCSTSSYNNMFNNSQPFHQENSFQNSYVGCSSERATKSNDCNHLWIKFWFKLFFWQTFKHPVFSPRYVHFNLRPRKHEVQWIHKRKLQRFIKSYEHSSVSRLADITEKIQRR